MLSNLTIILFHPKYPENVGSAARACVNMGCPNLVLVAPQSWDLERALPLATVHGAGVLKSARVVDTLEEGLEGLNVVYATTARTGGWRKGVLTPAQAAPDMARELGEGRVGVVFGPEDRGLTNDEIKLCGQLLTIPTAGECTSLNLSQAVVVVLYECFKAALDHPFRPAGPPASRLATAAEVELMFSTIQDMLLAIDYLKPDNPDYWMMPVRRFMLRLRLRRNEFNLVMGVCRQARWVAELARRAGVLKGGADGGQDVKPQGGPQ